MMERQTNDVPFLRSTRSSPNIDSRQMTAILVSLFFLKDKKNVQQGPPHRLDVVKSANCVQRGE